MKFLSHFLFILVCLGLSSCTQSEKQVEVEKLKTIQVSPTEAKNEINLSQFVDSISYVKLETNEKSFLGQITEIKIKDNFIYVADRSQQSIFIFNLKGEFFKKLSNQGDGPDRYRQLGPFFVDESEKSLEIIDFASDNTRIISYSLPDLEFIKSEPIKIALANSVRRKNGIYYFATQQIENTVNDSPTNGDIIAVDKKGTKKVLFDKNIPPGNSGFSPFTESFAYTGNDTLLISLMYQDTIYRLQNKEAFPYLRLDFGDFKLDPNIRNLSIQEQLQILQNESEGKVTFPVLNASTPNLLAFSYYFKEKNFNHTIQYLDFKKEKTTIHTRKIINDLTDFPKEIFISSYYSGIRHEVVYKDHLVDIILPAFSLDDEKEIKTKSLGKIKIEDNPIIVLMRIKDR
ncbi:MAG TPA: hypothetical protein DEQ87_16410 [Algoriphagus sp.]|jgi:hypothetical protein|uniref:6-bladed beta-propeller n=1 Tax=unclassified Algoriphagus TaxID=2641541 RepID=UPI000C629215|nr:MULTISPECIES: 6-bladed beta-propeller [unclassified Algoriphagus]MAL15974.1 hypothetical protein [Algoriphagus sp.]QYH40594.1 6-bladed beta-propeller [Algoriphagus sp. NBT04N3]HAS59490.1 hypothetical protein [Algoriphagus sp.]HAZ24559.1 hypothetical protein [Algoriphagus sp.]HCB47030.1 hypothetical protein [Algoriphagus sp.]|tara:strand:- start:187 stop:1389 length:1203 start_codon:yes stop_codon:yes gene_type:complete